MSDSIELVRARYRPEPVMVLFVGESAPAKGKFFYGDENAFAGHIRRAIWPDIIDHHDFLDRFRSCGWFLDDLVLEPIDNWKKPEKLAARAAARAALANRIREYRPHAIVALLKCIEKVVRQAAAEAECGADFFAVPFPGHGNQNRFREQMAVIVPKLPTLKARPMTTRHKLTITVIHQSTGKSTVTQNKYAPISSLNEPQSEAPESKVFATPDEAESYANQLQAAAGGPDMAPIDRHDHRPKPGQ